MKLTTITRVDALWAYVQPANPKNWGFNRRYALVALLGLTTMCSTFASSIFSTATPAVAAIYGVSTEVATLGTS